MWKRIRQILESVRHLFTGLLLLPLPFYHAPQKPGPNNSIEGTLQDQFTHPSLMYPPLSSIPTLNIIPLPCSTSPMTSLFTTWPPWPPSPQPSGPLIQATLTKLLCQLALPLHAFSHGISQPQIITHTTWATHSSIFTLTQGTPLRD